MPYHKANEAVVGSRMFINNCYCFFCVVGCYCFFCSNDNNNDIEKCISRFFTVSSLHMLKWSGHNGVQIMCNALSPYHMQHVMCNVIRRNSLAVKLKSHLL